MLQLNEVDSKRTLWTRDGLVVAGWSGDGKFLLTSSRTSVVRSSAKGIMMGWDIDPEPGVKLSVAFAQVWGVSCPVPTYQVRGSVERLLFRADGRQLAVNDTLWDVQPSTDRIALQQTALAAPSCLLGFRGTEVWTLSPAPGESDRDRVAMKGGGALSGSNSDSLHQRGQAEVGAILAARLAAVVPGPGTLAGLGYLFGDLGPIRWERPRVAGLLPAGREVVLAPPTDPRPKWFRKDSPGMSSHQWFRKDSPGITFLRPYRVAWSRDGAKLLAVVMGRRSVIESLPGEKPSWSTDWGDADRLVEAWDIPSGDRYPLALPKAWWTDIAWHPEAHRFATAGHGGVRVWDLATSAEVVTLSQKDADHLVWSDDGQYLLVVKEDKRAAVYTPEGREMCAWSALGKDWAAFSLSGEGRCVAAGGEDGLVHLRDVETGREVARWKAHDAAVTALTFGPGGRLLVSGARDGTVRVWDIPWIRAELAKLRLDW